MICMTSILTVYVTRTTCLVASYVALMAKHLSDANSHASGIHGIVVVGVTRDHAEIWSLDERQTSPMAVLVRHDEHGNHRHVRTGQFRHGHASDEGFDGYFADIATLLADAGEIMIAGHGTGRANAMEAFAEYLQNKDPGVFAKVTELRYVDLPHTTGRQLAGLARDWKRQQRVLGRGNANTHDE